MTLLEEGKPVDYQEVVTTTWKVSVDKLSDAAKQLFFLCTYFAPDNIPMQFIFASAENNDYLPQPLRHVLSTEISRKKCIGELTRYSFIKRLKDDLYSIHRLVQQVVRREADANIVYLNAGLNIIASELPRDYSTREHYEKFSGLSEHANSVLGFAEKAFASDKERLKTVEEGLRWLTEGYWRRCEYDESHVYCERDLAVCENVFGHESPETAAAYNNLGWLYRDFGEHKKALNMYEEALVIRKKILGEEHKDTATVCNNLGNVYRDMRDYEKAQAMFFEAIRIKEKVLGEENPNTATTYNNLGLLFYSMGEHEKALDMYNRALSISEKALGRKHPNVAAVSYNIGFVYRDFGEMKQALDLAVYAYRTWLDIHGEQHLYTQEAYEALREVYVLTGGKAKKLNKWLNSSLAVNCNSPETDDYRFLRWDSTIYISPMERYQNSKTSIQADSSTHRKGLRKLLRSRGNIK